MPFTVVAPYVGFPLKIDAEDFSSAAKKAIQLNQEIQIMSMIINDHNNNMRMLANVDYYNQQGRRKAGIKMSKTKALGYQGYPHLSPIFMGISTEDKPSEVGPFLIPMGVNGPILPFPGPMAVSGLGGPAIVAGPAGTALAAVPSGRMGPYGSPLGAGLPQGAVPVVSGLPFGFPFGFSSGDSIESLEKKEKNLTASIAGKEAALATPGISPSDSEKYTKEKKSLEADLVKIQVRLAELREKAKAK